MGFSLELEDLLTELHRRRWTIVRWGPEDAPDLLAAVFKWDTSADVLILRDEDRATGYRVPADEVFNPSVVQYQYHNNPLWTLRVMLTLPGPGQPGAPHGIEIPRRPDCFIPDNLPVPIVVRSLVPRGA